MTQSRNCPILLNRDGKGAGFEKSLAQLKTLRRVADESVNQGGNATI
jgi:hypothetical protein